MNFFVLITTFALSILLTACGGSSSSSNTDTSNPETSNISVDVKTLQDLYENGVYEFQDFHAYIDTDSGEPSGSLTIVAFVSQDNKLNTLSYYFSTFYGDNWQTTYGNDQTDDELLVYKSSHGGWQSIIGNHFRYETAEFYPSEILELKEPVWANMQISLHEEIDLDGKQIQDTLLEFQAEGRDPYLLSFTSDVTGDLFANQAFNPGSKAITLKFKHTQDAVIARGLDSPLGEGFAGPLFSTLEEWIQYQQDSNREFYVEDKINNKSLKLLFQSQPLEANQTQGDFTVIDIVTGLEVNDVTASWEILNINGKRVLRTQSEFNKETSIGPELLEHEGRIYYASIFLKDTEYTMFYFNKEAKDSVQEFVDFNSLSQQAI